jgi:sulfite exporter TauE/SafE
MVYYLLLFAAGFAGSFHCIGMCGGFACGLGRDPRGRSATVLRHLIYNSGRLTTYCFLGGLAGSLGEVLCTSRGLSSPLLSSRLDSVQRLLAIIAGLLMIAMALQFFGLLQVFNRFAAGFGASALAAALRSLLKVHHRAAPLAFGVLNGFLPCPLVYAFTAQAASTAGTLPGILTMASFGLGTFPAMLMMGGVGQLLAPVWRRRGVWLAGCFILLFGLITLARGIVPLAAHTGISWHSEHVPGWHSEHLQ